MNFYSHPAAAAAAAAAAAGYAQAAPSAEPEENDDLADDQEEEDEEVLDSRGNKRSNVLPLWGNTSNNLNPLIMTNIQGSPYFKVNLLTYKTYHQVIDEIYYKVDHLEPWERGSRKTSGQTGMCGGVRGVGAGGIVSSAFCLLFKLYTLKLTRKQLVGLLNHCDSPYIRGLGFMYIRFSQPPTDLWDWYEEYLDDEEEIDVKAGGGKTMTIGEMLLSFLTRLEWFDTRFPRIPVNVQKQINEGLVARRQPAQSDEGHYGSRVSSSANSSSSNRRPVPEHYDEGDGGANVGSHPLDRNTTGGDRNRGGSGSHRRSSPDNRGQSSSRRHRSRSRSREDRHKKRHASRDHRDRKHQPEQGP